jgi:hypothetical protein
MIAVTMVPKQIWNTLQEPRCVSPLPSGYLLLLSALDQGWKVSRLEIQPSWDQHGFVYLIGLWHPVLRRRQKVVLPETPQVEMLLAPYRRLLRAGHSASGRNN